MGHAVKRADHQKSINKIPLLFVLTFYNIFSIWTTTIEVENPPTKAHFSLHYENLATKSLNIIQPTIRSNIFHPLLIRNRCIERFFGKQDCRSVHILYFCFPLCRKM